MATELKQEELSRALATDVNDAEQEARGDESQDRHFVTALARGLEVLSCFRSGDSFLANHEIAMRCGLPKSTVTRLTYTLTKLGYLHLVPDSGKYRLGTATAALGSSMLVNLDVRQVARPYLRSLAAETGAVVALTTRDRLSMLYLECCRSTSIVTLSLDVGSRIPLGTSASGMALLAALPASERADLMERIRDLDQGNWPHTERGILKAIEEYRATGCATSAGNWIREVHGIATPLWPGRGLPLMTISVAGAAGYFPVARLHEEIRPKLLDTVREIERNLGQRPEAPAPMP
ncbi:IclR family transcriptional regulator [Cupriavidus sp. WKF15]|uniref:IclR family transcriptional regulator n=1 Tax=Cupriavidus sp. WKF15 TaxID=3032282 RepID=UPI0023E30038|nr:IclR family transcriptional regulator [Cupriavidus sp. WKF15]WER49861.1 IclR family transcriptional regulator [Cupriavidus sp. WKF15]